MKILQKNRTKNMAKKRQQKAILSKKTHYGHRCPFNAF